MESEPEPNFFDKQRAIARAVTDDKDYNLKQEQLLVCALVNKILRDWKERVAKASETGKTSLILYEYSDDETITVGEQKVGVNYIMGIKPGVIERINTIMERHGKAKASRHESPTKYGNDYIELDWQEEYDC